MAVDSYDPTTGRPIFLDTGAPDIGVDPTEVGKYAADVGTRIIRPDLTALEAYPFKRPGLAGYAAGRDYVHDGTGWRVTVAPLTAYTPTVTGLNLSQVTVEAKYEQIGSRVRGEVLITRNAAGLPSASVAFTLPFPPANSVAVPRSLGVGTVYLANNTTAYQSFTRYTGGGNASINIASVAGSAVAQGTNVSNIYPTTSAHAVGTFYQALFDYEV